MPFILIIHLKAFIVQQIRFYYFSHFLLYYQFLHYLIHHIHTNF